MARPVWKGAISFGLLNIPVNLINAEKSNDLKFNLVDSKDKNRIRYVRVNEETGEEVPWNEIVKAFEFSDNNYVMLTDEDFKMADLKATKTIDIETFINGADLSLMYIEKPYYIEPSKGGEKAYVLLRDALKKTEKIAISRVVIRTREYLAAIYPDNELLILNLIRFNQEIKPIDDLKIPENIKIKPKEMELAVKLIEDMTEEWVPENYEDEYRKSLMELIEEKAKGVKVTEEDEEEIDQSNVIDILDLLKQSVDANDSKKSEKKENSSKSKSSEKSKKSAS